MSIVALLAIEESSMLLFNQFFFRQFYPLLFGFFRFVPGFAEGD
jgi:hypothetical protein